VHGELGCADVDRLDARLRGHHGADRGAAKRVISHDELLDGDAGTLSEDFEDGGAHSVGHVALVSIDLEDDTLLHLRLMVTLMLLTVVGVDGVGHIG